MKLKNFNILVTGGAGFIGSHLVETLARENHVTVYDNFSSSVVSPSYLRNLRNVTVVKGDILDEKKLGKALQGIDVVFHLAVACVRLSLSQSRHVHEVNATGTLTTLLASTKARIKRFVYISSSEVYGTTDEIIISENHPIRPTTVYGLSKYMGELYTKLFFDRQGLPVIIIRPFNTYGPRSHFEGVYGEVIPRFVMRALSGKQPIIFGDGAQTRDFTYIADTVSGIIKASQTDELLGSVTNIAYGKEVSILEIARSVCKLTGIDARPVIKPARPHDIRRLAADIRFAQKKLHYAPQVSIEEGLARYIAWVKQTVPNPERLLKKIPEKNW